jgi:hypothetical protein
MSASIFKLPVFMKSQWQNKSQMGGQKTLFTLSIDDLPD